MEEVHASKQHYADRGFRRFSRHAEAPTHGLATMLVLLYSSMVTVKCEWKTDYSAEVAMGVAAVLVLVFACVVSLAKTGAHLSHKVAEIGFAFGEMLYVIAKLVGGAEFYNNSMDYRDTCFIPNRKVSIGAVAEDFCENCIPTQLNSELGRLTLQEAAVELFTDCANCTAYTVISVTAVVVLVISVMVAIGAACMHAAHEVVGTTGVEKEQHFEEQTEFTQ